MADDILLRFLSAGLVDVGGDDAKLERLRATADDLAAALGQTPSKTTSFSLIAFDSDAPPSDPVFAEAKAALQNRWATYVNTFAGTPVAVLRAILLDALFKAAAKDDRVGVAFVVSARNVLPLMPNDGGREIWIDVIREVERKVDARAEAEWATPASIIVTPLSLDMKAAAQLKMSKPTTNREFLTKAFHAAAGPQAGGVATNGNPQWPSANGPWVAEFGTRLAAGVGDVIDAVVEKINVEPFNFAPMLQKVGKAISAHVDASLAAVSSATAGLQRRADLLWWKESLYSPSAGTSYRELSLSNATALMAFDLFNQIPTFSPASVSAFLRETVRCLSDVDKTQPQPISSLLEAVQNASELAGLRKAAADMVASPLGRGPLLGLIAHPHAWSGDKGQFRNLVGIEADTPITASDWAVWIFRELQAARAVTEATAAVRPENET
jgi:hypothetical protein